MNYRFGPLDNNPADIIRAATVVISRVNLHPSEYRGGGLGGKGNPPVYVYVGCCCGWIELCDARAKLTDALLDCIELGKLRVTFTRFTPSTC